MLSYVHVKRTKVQKLQNVIFILFVSPNCIVYSSKMSLSKLIILEVDQFIDKT